MKLLKKIKMFKKSKGFTLVELIVVIAIIGILAAVLIPSITGYIDNAKDSAALQEAETIKTAYEAWLIERIDFEDSNNEKTDFLLYLTSLKVLSDGQGIIEAVPNADPDDKIGLGESFILIASNARRVQFDYVSESGKLTMKIVD